MRKWKYLSSFAQTYDVITIDCAIQRWNRNKRAERILVAVRIEYIDISIMQTLFFILSGKIVRASESERKMWWISEGEREKARELKNGKEKELSFWLTIHWKESATFITCDQRKDNNFRVFTTNYNVICSKIYGDRCKQTKSLRQWLYIHELYRMCSAMSRTMIFIFIVIARSHSTSTINASTRSHLLSVHSFSWSQQSSFSIRSFVVVVSIPKFLVFN